MTERELRYITTIAQEGNLTRAAESLRVAQPSLTLALQRLEHTLGAKLFRRTAAGLLPTPAGARYLEGALEIQKRYRDMTFEIGGISQMYHGEIRLGITSHLGTMLLPYLLPKYKTLFPNIQILLTEDASTQLEEKLQRGQLDFALMHRPLTPTTLTLETLAHDSFLLAISQDSPWAQTEIASADILRSMAHIRLMPQQRIGQMTARMLRNAQVTPTETYVTGNIETARAMAAMGVGATFVPASYTRFFPSVKAPCYLPLPAQWEGTWELCIAYPKQSVLPRPCAEFATLVRAHVAESGGVYEP